MKQIKAILYSYLTAGIFFVPVWVTIHLILPINEDADPARYGAVLFVVMGIIVRLFFGKWVMETMEKIS
jgi:hypothetical protein